MDIHSHSLKGNNSNNTTLQLGENQIVHKKIICNTARFFLNEFLNLKMFN